MKPLIKEFNILTVLYKIFILYPVEQKFCDIWKFRFFLFVYKDKRFMFCGLSRHYPCNHFQILKAFLSVSGQGNWRICTHPKCNIFGHLNSFRLRRRVCARSNSSSIKTGLPRKTRLNEFRMQHFRAYERVQKAKSVLTLLFWKQTRTRFLVNASTCVYFSQKIKK